MVKCVKLNTCTKPVTTSTNSHNTPTNDTQSRAYQRAEKLYKQHKTLIDKLASR